MYKTTRLITRRKLIKPQKGLFTPLGGVKGAPVIPGASPPALPYTPSVRFHPNTATMTLRSDGSFQGYVTNKSLVVTTYSVTTCEGLRDGMKIFHASLPGGSANIIGLSNQVSGPASGNGGTGQYLLDVSGVTIGSSGSPVTFTTPGRQVVAINDLTGNSDGLQSPDGSGPIVVTDGYGRKALLFHGNYSNLGAWLRNATYPSVDSHCAGWLIVGRVLDDATGNFVTNTSPIIGMGYPGSGQNTSFTESARSNVYRLQGNLLSNNLIDPTLNIASPSVRNRMFLGMQMQVLGSAAATSDGYNGAATSHNTAIILNEQVAVLTSNRTRTLLSGFSVNASASSNNAAPSTSTHNHSLLIIYDIVGFLRGELGTDVQMPTRLAAVSAALMTGYGIPAITKALTTLGDSRFANRGSNYFPDTGFSIAEMLCRPGMPYATPANVRVQNYAVGGQGVGVMQLVSELTASSTASFRNVSSVSPSFQLGGGADYFALLSGTNDIGSSKWPTTAGASGSNAQIDDLYSGNNGSGYSGSFDATISNNSQSLTLANVTGNVLVGSLVTGGTGWIAGMGVRTVNSGTSASLGGYQTPALSAVATTVRVDGYVPLIAKLLARGFKGVWCSEPKKNSPTSSGLSYFAAKVETDAVNDVGANVGGTYPGALVVHNTTAITVGGKAIFGSDYVDYDQYYVDFIHYTEAGRMAFVSGGDTIANGLAAKVNTVLAA